MPCGPRTNCAQLCQRHGERGYECWSLTIEGEAALANGDWEPAQRRGTAALALAETTGGAVGSRPPCRAAAKLG